MATLDIQNYMRIILRILVDDALWWFEKMCDPNFQNTIRDKPDGVEKFRASRNSVQLQDR